MLLPASVAAQQKHSFLYKVDSLLTIHMRAKGDTNYVSRPNKRLTFRILNNVSGTSFVMRGTDSEYNKMKVYFKDPLRYTVTLSANYRGLAVSFAFNPAHLMGKKTSTEFNINSYGNHYGFDFLYEKNGEYDVSFKKGDDHFYSPNSNITEKSMTINGYYAINGDKFSYPAAFSQSYIQKKSAGSLMIGGSYHRSTIGLRAEDPDIDYEAVNKLKMSYAGIGLGYGYNFVPSRNWLLHASVLPSLVLWNESKIVYNGYVKRVDAHFPEYSLVARGAVIHYFKSFFTGLTMVYNFTSAGDMDKLRLDHNKWRARFILGMRFW